jgi:hypothetical protein
LLIVQLLNPIVLPLLIPFMLRSNDGESTASRPCGRDRRDEKWQSEAAR